MSLTSNETDVIAVLNSYFPMGDPRVKYEATKKLSAKSLLAVDWEDDPVALRLLTAASVYADKMFGTPQCHEGHVVCDAGRAYGEPRPTHSPAKGEDSLRKYGLAWKQVEQSQNWRLVDENTGEVIATVYRGLGGLFAFRQREFLTAENAKFAATDTIVKERSA